MRLKKHRYLKVELGVLIFVVCIWVVKSATIDIDSVKAGVLKQVVKVDRDNVEIDNNQTEGFDTYVQAAQGNNPVEEERALRLLRQNLTTEQQLYIVELINQADELTERENKTISQIQTYIEKEKELQDLLQANQKDYDLSRQSIRQQYRLPQQQSYLSQPNPTVSTKYPTTLPPLGAINVNRYNPNSLANPYGAGNPYKPNGLMNPYSPYGNPYSNKSWRNPYATDAPKLYDSQGNYRGRLSTNPYAPDSTSNPYGRYGNPYSPDSINNPYGAGNPYLPKPIYIVPSE